MLKKKIKIKFKHEADSIHLPALLRSFPRTFFRGLAPVNDKDASRAKVSFNLSFPMSRRVTEQQESASLAPHGKTFVRVAIRPCPYARVVERHHRCVKVVCSFATVDVPAHFP